MNYLHTSFLCPKVPFLVALYILSEIIISLSLAVGNHC
jgi:hypothetical protein